MGGGVLHVQAVLLSIGALIEDHVAVDNYRGQGIADVVPGRGPREEVIALQW